MKITMYELLGLVKDGKAPEKIKFRNEIYEYENNIKDSFIDYVGIEKETNGRFYLSSHIGNNYISDIFTDEVEIIEEPKKIEKLPYYSLEKIQKSKSKDEWYENRLKLLEKRINDYHNKTNELIDEINKLKEND